AIAVAGHDPDVQLRPGKLQPGRERRRSAVDAVEAVRIHVVREARRTPDTGDEDGLRPVDAELGEDLLGLHEDGVVAAAGTPADVLVRGVVGRLEGELGWCGTHSLFFRSTGFQPVILFLQWHGLETRATAEAAADASPAAREVVFGDRNVQRGY